jgi:hypothetical protein
MVANSLNANVCSCDESQIITSEKEKDNKNIYIKQETS